MSQQTKEKKEKIVKAIKKTAKADADGAMLPAKEANNTKGDLRGQEVWHIPLSRILVDEHFNGRTESSYGDMDAFKALIKESGQLQPGTAFKTPDGMWHLNSGHRRLRALQILSKEEGEERTMKLIKGAKDYVGRFVEQWVENVKETPSDYSRALIIKGLLEGEKDADGNVIVKGLTPREIQAKLTISQAHFYNLKNMLDLPEPLLEAVKTDVMSGSTATKMNRALSGDQQDIAAAVEKAKETAKAAGKTKVSDKHTDTAKTRTPQSIMKACVKRLEAKVENERLSKNETFTLELFRKVLASCSDNVLNNLIRNGTK